MHPDMQMVYDLYHGNKRMGAPGVQDTLIYSWGQQEWQRALKHLGRLRLRSKRGERVWLLLETTGPATWLHLVERKER